MSNTTVWLIRHGQSTANLGTWSCDPNGIVLTEKGYRQALAIADQITTRPDLIISSPMQRALQTAAPTRKKWADVPVEIWPIQEFSYLSPPNYQTTTADERKKIIHDYWQKAIPTYCDGEHAESFSDFIHRVETFHRALLGAVYISTPVVPRLDRGIPSNPSINTRLSGYPRSLDPAVKPRDDDWKELKCQKALNKSGYIVIFGHGQFFKAFLLGSRHGFFATSAWMTLFRQSETAQPILNGEIIPWHPEKSMARPNFCVIAHSDRLK